MGKKVGEAAAKLRRHSGWLKDSSKKVGVLSVEVQTLSVCNDRTDKRRPPSRPPACDANIFPVPYTGETASAQDAAGPVITAHPDITNWVVFGCNDEGVLGTLNALATAGVANRTSSPSASAPTRRASRGRPSRTPPWKAALFISGLDVGKTAATCSDDAVNGKPPPAQTIANTTIVDPTNYKTMMDQISVANCSK